VFVVFKLHGGRVKSHLVFSRASVFMTHTLLAKVNSGYELIFRFSEDAVVGVSLSRFCMRGYFCTE
jgi:hypothetical protein